MTESSKEIMLRVFPLNIAMFKLKQTVMVLVLKKSSGLLLMGDILGLQRVLFVCFP